AIFELRSERGRVGRVPRQARREIGPVVERVVAEAFAVVVFADESVQELAIVVEMARRIEVHTVTRSVAETQLVAFVPARLEADRGLRLVLRLLGDDVDETAGLILAVENGHGAAHELDALDVDGGRRTVASG